MTVRVLSRGQCGDLGPWGTVCTEDSTHRYAHYDASDDSSWTNEWREWFDHDSEALLTADVEFR